MIMASSNKRITLLFILPAIFATVQSAALRRSQLDNCDSTPLGAKVLEFHCRSYSLRTLTSYMLHVSTKYFSVVRCISNKVYHLQEHHAVVLAAENDNVQSNNQANIRQMLQQFDFTCKTFTTAMAIKHQLQYSIFSGSYYFNDSNGTLVQVTSEEYMRNLTLSLQYIETIASILQNMEVQLRCILTNNKRILASYHIVI